MAQQNLNVGTVANDHTGDTLRSAAQKIQSNFDELYAGVTAGVTKTMNQTIAASRWVLRHNLGYPPLLVIVDSIGRVVGGDVTYADPEIPADYDNPNVLYIDFIADFSGTIYYK